MTTEAQSISRPESAEKIRELLDQPDRQLALSGLSRQLEIYKAKLSGEKENASFKSRKPDVPPSARDAEEGSLDRRDREIARAERDEYLAENSEEAWEKRERDTEMLWTSIEALEDDISAVENGNEGLIATEAERERTRLSKLLAKAEQEQN